MVWSFFQTHYAITGLDTATSISTAKRTISEKKAKVIKRTPFTIELLYGSTGYKQEVLLGVDAGSKTVGLSATTENKELFLAEVE